MNDGGPGIFEYVLRGTIERFSPMLFFSQLQSELGLMGMDLVAGHSSVLVNWITMLILLIMIGFLEN